jgi:hypothetical protein
VIRSLLGVFFENCRSSPNIWATFYTVKGMHCYWATFFTNSSGHPDQRSVTRSRSSHAQRALFELKLALLYLTNFGCVRSSYLVTLFWFYWDRKF